MLGIPKQLVNWLEVYEFSMGLKVERSSPGQGHFNHLSLRSNK
jgi:hypothetical protein